LRKTIPAVIAAAVAAAFLLAGCTPSSTTSGGCTPVKSGSVSDSIKVSGSTKAAPKVTFSKPLKGTTTQRTVVVTGKGAATTGSSTVDISAAIYNGSSGKELTSVGYGTVPTLSVTASDTTAIPILRDAVKCAPVGSRIVATGEAKTALSPTDPSQIGLKDTDTVVLVADIRDIAATKATGKPQPQDSTLPTVKDAANGKPTVTIPKTAAPTETKSEVIKKGTGAAVKSTDNVTIQYQGLIWDTRKIFQQTWGSSPYTGPADQFVPGFTKSLVGQTVGSQILMVIPPADGYGPDGNAQAGIKGTDTLVFVVDILKAQPAAS
jgi:peptidylprolyl isomerase